MIREVPKTIEVPQDQFIDKAAECAPVDFGPAMAGRIARRSLVAYTSGRHSSHPLGDTTNETDARTNGYSATESSRTQRLVGGSGQDTYGTPAAHFGAEAANGSFTRTRHEKNTK